MNFNFIAGHRRNIKLIKQMLEGKRIPHGILFAGPEGVGKRLTAAALTAALNCENPGLEGACGECPSCRKLRSGNHPMTGFIGSPKNEDELVARFGNGGLIKIKNITALKTGPDEEASPDKKTVKINISQIRQIKREASLKPYKSMKKVIIMDDIAEASAGALNCLLKILEEPPENNYFILITSNRDALPATVISRCQEYRFSPLTEKQMKDFLNLREDIGASSDEAARHIRISGGSPGRFVEYSEIDITGPDISSAEKYFKSIKKWMGDKAESLRKLNVMLQIEGYGFRNCPSPEGWSRLMVIEETIESLNKNANRELAISNMFLKLDQIN